IAPVAPLALTRVDLRSTGDPRREALRLAGEDAVLPFDLVRGPLVRLSLLRLGEDERVLLLAMHHIVSDGWSLGLFVRELTTLYTAFASGQPSPLPELAVQYPDYAVWQRQWLQGEELTAQLAHWRERLAGAEGVLDLPVDRPRPPAQSFRGGELPLTLSGDFVAALEALGRRGGATLFMTLLAGWKALLWRSTGEVDLRVGTPVANRTRLETEPLIGFFVNTLVLRTDLAGDPGFGELLGRVRLGTLDAYGHQHLPFERLVEELQPERDLSHTPLFQVLVALQNDPVPALDLPGLRVRRMEVGRATAKFDLSLMLERTARGIAGSLEYASDLFDASTAGRILSHFRVLLEGVAASPEAPLSALPLLTGEEREQLLAWNKTGTAAGGDLCLHELVEAQAQRTPQAPALIAGADRLTYEELNRRASSLAEHLGRLGVGPEVGVGVFLDRSVDLVVSLLAVLKAGGLYVPLDPAYPAERVGFILGDTAAPVILSRESLAGRLPATGSRLVLVDRDAGAWSEWSGRSPHRAGGPDHLAYVIYTSGSTGRPKGVAIEHRSAVALVRWSEQVYSPAEISGVLASTSICFDLSVFELFVPLGRGGAVILAENALELTTLAARDSVTLVNTVPSAIAELVRMGGVPASVQTVNLAGEPLQRDLVQGIYGLGTVERVYNLYGPSEDTTYSTFTLVERGPARPVTIGRPLTGKRSWVLDGQLSQVPVGVVGELYLGGEGLARGYLNRPELTAERWVPDPFSAEPGARLYRTGDLARRLSDGTLLFLGRIDHQVKVRGFRIELGEVEAALLRHAGVREAVVAAREDRLVAYVVAEPGREPAVPDLREHLLRSLPEPMVPSVFVRLEALPLTPNGKVDRKALPEPEPMARWERTAPRTPLEERLAAIWSDLLGVEEIGIEENFFDLGGHSLLAMRVIFRVREELGVELAVRTLFERPTVAALSAILEQLGADRPASAVPPLQPVPRDGGLPLSFAQERLWFLHELLPGRADYNIAAALRLSGRLDLGALQRTLTEIARRQESLRTTFRLADGQPVQWIGPAEPWHLPLVDLTALGPEEREREARHRAAEEGALPFDLAVGPLVRTALLRLGPAEHILVLAAHHAVFDGWSVGILTREMGALYPVLAQGGDGRGLLPELPVQYADFAVWQRRWLAGGELDRQLAWWRERLAGAPALLELPADRPRPKTPSGQGGTRSSRLAPDLAAALHALGRGRGATLFMTLFAGWAALLHRYTGETDLPVGTPVANRPRAALEDLVGLFVNSLVLRTDLDGDPAFLELVGRVREGLLGAQAHQDLPFEKLVEALAPQRSTAHTPLFQVLFVLQNAPFTALELPGLTLSPVEIEGRTAQLDLSLSLTESVPEIAATLEFNRDLFDPATADRMLGHLEVLLAGAAAAPHVRLSELPLLSAAERRQLQAEAGAADGVSPGESCLHWLFDEQAARTPQAVALVCGGTSLTYAELRERADRLARRLAGIAPEAPVGVCMESSPELVVSLLAVWKAGGVYLPLDPVYPPERLAFMVEDAGACAVLTSEQRPMLPWAGSARVVVVPGHAAPDGEPRPPRSLASPGSLAWIIYTSGSTGTPKGVGVEHGAAADHMRNVVDAWGLGCGDRVLQLSSSSFDMSLEEIVAPLLCGCTVVLRGSDVWEPSGLLDRVSGLGLTVVNLPTAYWQQWIWECEQGSAAEGLPLRLVVVGGEAVPVEAARRWHRTPLGGVRLLNGYGPTEAVISASFHEVGAGEAAPDGSVPIGRPLSGRSGWVLDRRGAPVPTGVPGELHLGGRSLARGYLGRPALTAERFVPDPFSAVPGSRLYRTGDMARRLADGPLSFLGRTDQQVKVRGFRIEPAEVEAALTRHPAVREAVVVARELAGGKALVAYVVASGAPPAASELRDHLRASLPEHMVPSAFVLLDSLPLTPNGKVDRRALPAPEIEAERGFVAPRTPVEELLAGLWAELLNVERVGAEDHFFELGGHSLLATRVVSQLRGIFGVELPLRALFESPTVATLARRVEEARREEGAPAAPPIVPVARDGELPLSFAQERLWFLDQLDPGSAAYNIVAAVCMDGPLNEGALEAALREIVRRHEALRTTFPAVEGRPMQRIAPLARLVLTRVDLRSAGDPRREALRLAAQDAMLPFDLARGPLVRCSLLRLGEEESVLLVAMHHIVSDGWSLDLFVRELSVLYTAFASGQPSTLPELAVQYPDYAVWQRQWLQGKELAAQLAHWRERLAGAEGVLDLPADRPRPPVQSFRGGELPLTLSGDLVAALEALGRRGGATLFMTLLA
ncbi:MAG TPA: amino acid adenylation domain-containing protein, partial [Thermoanaerobaculia bacterium]|nr:amino acid adenylation domain-containing protein [Thermoanaerobaculia bacterium]